MHATDNPPAYNADVLPNLPSRSTGSYLPPATVDQVHIFSRHEDIKGMLTSSPFCHLLTSPGTFFIDPNIPSLRRKCKRKSPQLLHASFRTRKADISIDLGTTGDMYDAKKANIEVSTDKGDIKINLVCA